METVVQDHTPLADYLIGRRHVTKPQLEPAAACKEPNELTWLFLTIGEGEADASDWATPDLEPDFSSSPPSSPGFAPKGRPTVRSRFRSNAPPPIRLEIPKRSPLRSLKSRYSVRQNDSVELFASVIVPNPSSTLGRRNLSDR